MTAADGAPSFCLSFLPFPTTWILGRGEKNPKDNLEFKKRSAMDTTDPMKAIDLETAGPLRSRDTVSDSR
jgi:hypothetical protein